MPQLWEGTIDEHRRRVRDTIIGTTVALVAERGLISVTMSGIAETAGIGRATLYKYFADVEAILRAWHQRQIDAHLDRLARAADGTGDPGVRLAAVLSAYASIVREARGHSDTELAALLHGDDSVVRAEARLRRLVQDVLTEAAVAGDVRDDVPTEHLATYCLHALAAARALPSDEAVTELVELTLSALAPRAQREAPRRRRRASSTEKVQRTAH